MADKYTERCVSFAELTLNELYEIVRLRHQVFVMEQKCFFMDADRYDQTAHHYMLFAEDGSLAGYTRLFDVNNPYPGYMSIGRVVTHPDHRNKKCGRLLMSNSIIRIKELFGNHPIKIGAQGYLKGFYASLGFIDVGEYYLEDGIPHLKMVRL